MHLHYVIANPFERYILNLYTVRLMPFSFLKNKKSASDRSQLISDYRDCKVLYNYKVKDIGGLNKVINTLLALY